MVHCSSPYSKFHPELPVIPKAGQFKRFFIWKKTADETRADSHEQLFHCRNAFTLLKRSILHDTWKYFQTHWLVSVTKEKHAARLLRGVVVEATLCRLKSNAHRFSQIQAAHYIWFAVECMMASPTLHKTTTLPINDWKAEWEDRKTTGIEKEQKAWHPFER